MSNNDIITPNDTQKGKGNWITCKLCGQNFKFISKESRESWQNINLQCPFCKEEYCILPKTERDLRKLQDQYFLNNRDEKFLTQMFFILVDYAESIIKKKYGTKMSLTTDTINDYARDASALLIERYMSKNFEIKISFAGFLKHKIKQAMFHKKEHSCAPETINYKYNDGNVIELEDDQEDRPLNKLFIKEEITHLVDYISNVVFAVEQSCDSPKQNYKRLISTEIYLNKKRGLSEFRKFHRTFEELEREEENYQKRYRTDRYMSLRTLDLIREILLILSGYNYEDFK